MLYFPCRSILDMEVNPMNTQKAIRRRGKQYQPVFLTQQEIRKINLEARSSATGRYAPRLRGVYR